MLGTQIQGSGQAGLVGHDAIEDARAALRLYQEYMRLRAQVGCGRTGGSGGRPAGEGDTCPLRRARS